jgi:hypothetical protein
MEPKIISGDLHEENMSLRDKFIIEKSDKKQNHTTNLK